MRTLNDLRRGERALIARITGVGGDDVTVRRLHEMGFDDGVEVEMLHRGPVGGDPLALRVGNMVVGLRKALAAMILIEALPTSRIEVLAATVFAEAAE